MTAISWHIVFYFTTWNVLLVFMYKWTARYVDLLYTTLVVLVLSTYFAYIQPGYLIATRADGTQHAITGVHKHVYHLIFHAIPFLFIAYSKWTSGGYTLDYMTLGISMAVFYIYMCVINVERFYGVTRQEMVLASFIPLILVYLISNFASHR